MRLTETITIYLAVGASFGVSSYLCAQESIKSRRQAFFRGMTGALFWPLVGVAILFRHLRLTDGARATYESRESHRALVEDARRSLLASVNQMLEATRRLPLVNSGEIELTLYVLRESAEQYIELAEAVAAVDENARPASYEMELARISGRRGEDLLIAGLCAHRRNITRIRERSARARSRLLKALAELGTQAGTDAAQALKDGEHQQIRAARMEVFAQAAPLFSLLGDMPAAEFAQQLLNAECLHSMSEKGLDRKGVGHKRAHAYEKCISHKPKLSYRDRLRETTFTQG